MSKTPNFEEALASLEKTVSKLESGECSLEESIKLFEDGMNDIKICRTALDNAQKKIITLTEIEEEDSLE